MSDDWKRVQHVAAAASRALVPAATRELFARAFRRDVTVTGYRVRDVVESLGLPHRSSLRSTYLPGRLVIATDDDDDISDDALADFAARGGTLICEASHGLVLVERAGIEHRPAAVAPGRREVSGPAVDRLPWKPHPPLAFIDDAAAAARFASGEVLVRDTEGVPLVTRVPFGKGTLVHLAWETAPFERKSSTSATTHRALAAQLRIPAVGILSTDTPIDAEQVGIQLLAYAVLADLAATALATSGPSRARTSPSPSV